MQAFDGVMLGRAAWHNPGILADISRALSPDLVLPEPAQIVHDMAAYAEGQVKRGVPLRIIVKPMLGWMSGRSGARPTSTCTGGCGPARRWRGHGPR